MKMGKTNVEMMIGNAVGVSEWENKTQILSEGSRLRDALAESTKIMKSVQKPFLVQPIWKTKGQSLSLSENCFDVFVWSDASIVSLPAKIWSGNNHGAIRHLREIARHVRALYDVLNTGDFDYEGTYKGMALGERTRVWPWGNVQGYGLGGTYKGMALGERTRVWPWGNVQGYGLGGTYKGMALGERTRVWPWGNVQGCGLGETYKGVALGEQTDKAFSMWGNSTRQYMQHKRLIKPALSKDTLESIVLNGGQYELKPERRFDATVVAHLSH